MHIAVNKLKDGPLSALLSTLNSNGEEEEESDDDGRGTGRGGKEKKPAIDEITPPKLNIVVMVIGSRGDVQPFVAIARVLKEKYGHRVRLATHPAFREFVVGEGVDFFSVGGDPAELMAFMVKNPVSACLCIILLCKRGEERADVVGRVCFRASRLLKLEMWLVRESRCLRCFRAFGRLVLSRMMGVSGRVGRAEGVWMEAGIGGGKELRPRLPLLKRLSMGVITMRRRGRGRRKIIRSSQTR